ncbi:MAG: NAD-dependent deacetylase [Gammaproteobacteria bacterium]|nr:MAG: NAD-dependent deacetylase [Gammaproteobacteria bacterium]
MEDLDRFAQMLEDAQRVVLFTGAGISTESGIPDFRSPGTGLWTKIKPIEFQDFLDSEDVRQESWSRRFSAERTIENAVPNKGHEACARLIESGKATAVITQNIDNLHLESGIPADQIIELHGNSTYAKCLQCEMRYEMADLESQFEATGRVAPCSACGGIIKSATISFGQAMPVEEVRRAEAVTLECDLFVVIGSSLVVFPAADLPVLGKQVGAGLVIVNREPTPLDEIADLVLHREIGPSMSYVVGIN